MAHRPTGPSESLAFAANHDPQTVLTIEIRKEYAAAWELVQRQVGPAMVGSGLVDGYCGRDQVGSRPTALHTRKTAAQKILNKLSWRAVPLKQLSATAWIVGAAEKDSPPADVFQFADAPVLIKRHGAQAMRRQDEVVLAAPPGVKKTLGAQISKGTWRAPSAVSADSQMECSQPGPMKSLPFEVTACRVPR